MKCLDVFKDEATWEKHINPEGNLTDEGEAAWEKVQPVYEELLKIQEDWNNEFADWIVLF
jgi:hypothetical protein